MEIQSHFYDDPDLTGRFIELQSLVFPGLDLAWAHANDFLPPTTVPFGIFEDGKALSILNATRMDFNVHDDTFRALQFGTVATHPDFLKQGLARRLMQHVLDAFQHRVDFFFLYANPTVLDFYPKFGFKAVDEPVFLIDLNPEEPVFAFRKLDVTKTRDRNIVIARFQSRTAISKACCIRDYGHLATWYCLTFYKDCVWYCDATETLLVATQGKPNLVVYDVVSDAIDAAFFKHLRWPKADTAVLHFIPDRFDAEFEQRNDVNADQLFIKHNRPCPRFTIKIPHLAYT